MTRLSEKEVLARSHASCLANVRKLISWGSNLTDISIVREMVNLEVLNVSVNNLTSLSDLSHCPRLKELYIRKNNVSNIEEITFLKNLPQLSVLWINDNPICDTSHYRETIIRTLPNLSKLDSIVINEEEHDTAERLGQLLVGEEVLPDYEGLDLNHTLSTDAVALHIKNNLSNHNYDEKIPNGNKSEVNGDLSECGSSDLELEPTSLKNSSGKDSNTVSAIKLLLNDLGSGDLQNIVSYAQNILKSQDEECRRSILED